MNAAHDPSSSPSEPKAKRQRSRSERFWSGFWLTFLVASLAYAWYSFYTPPNRIAWLDDYATAQQEATETGQPILLFFTGAWCVPCRIMKREVWADDQVVAKVNADFHPVTIDVDDPNALELLSRYHTGITPTTVLTDARGKILHRQSGRVSKADFLALLSAPTSAATEG